LTTQSHFNTIKQTLLMVVKSTT